ncbi:serpin family protein [soil metagenome]
MKKCIFLLMGILIFQNANSQHKLVESNNDFAFKIYKATKSDSSNYFISPFSLNIALAIANEGAASATRREMDDLLSIENIGERTSLYSKLMLRTTDLDSVDFQQCLQWSENKEGKNSLTIANSLWINDNFKIDNDFKKSIESNYNSQIFGFNKQNLEVTNKAINNWVSRKTNNKMTEVPGIDGSTSLSIINAIHFSGEWEFPFDKEETRKKKFYMINKKPVYVNYMRIQTMYRYFEDNEIQSIQLPYKCDQFSMIVILPKKRYGLVSIEQKLTASFFSKIQSAGSQEIILSLPKFRIESEIEPKGEIVKMGYGNMFSDAADFSGISKNSSLKISRITHKTFIEIDEKKTEAAAVTKIDVVTGYGGGEPAPPPPPKIFNADHPFMFLIVDNRTGAIIFTGRFVRD